MRIVQLLGTHSGAFLYLYWYYSRKLDFTREDVGNALCVCVF